MRIVLDTNVLVSAFAARGLCADLFRDVLAHHTLIVSDYILDELQEKLRVPSPVVESIRALLMPHRLTVDALPEVTVTIRDHDDIAIVAFAMAIGADILITGDRDLLDVSDILPVRVISPRKFYDT